MQDRFRFRVWDKRECRYIEAPRPTPLLQADGLLAYFTDHPEYMENYDIQFCTGLKDKNGKLIYEGDIVKNWDNLIYQFFWQEDAACYLVENIRSKNKLGIYSLISYQNNLEVIGNIYENKELLEQ
jgi:uncharacterized phage protein (TIGR01671 family)